MTRNSEQREREGEAPQGFLVEGATRAPMIDAELSTQLAAIKKSLGLTEQGDDKK